MKFDNDFKEIKIRHIVIMFFLIVLISIGILVLLNANGKINNTTNNELSLILEVLLAIMLVFKIKPSKKNVKRLYLDFKNKVNMKEITCVIFLISCLEFGSSNILTDIAYIISPSFANWFVSDSEIVINSMTDYWIVLIIGIFFAPFTEEVIFRNVLFKRLSKKFNIYIGLIVSSIIFSSMNFGNQMVGLFLFGIINCMLYVKYENILIPMFVYLIDGIISIVKFILFDEFGNQAIILTSNDIILYAVSGSILFIIGTKFFIDFISENKVYLREIYNNNKTL